MATPPTPVPSSSPPPPPSGPLNALGEPLLLDPSAHWETIRAAWLARRPAAGSKAVRDPRFSERIVALRRLLLPHEDDPSALEGQGNGGQVVEVEQEEEEEADGGEVVRDKWANGRDAAKVATESILMAFRQGRPLKDKLPLSLVTGLLYGSWLRDGTIPPDYKTASNSPPNLAGADGPPSLPPSISPIVPVAATERLPYTEHKRRKNPLEESRWRTEKDVASGSDVL